MSHASCGFSGKRFLSVVAFAFCFASACLLAPLANATLLNPGSFIPSAGEPDPVGAVPVTAPLVSPFVSPSFSGTLVSQVWKNDASSPYGINSYTFTYFFSNDATSNSSLDRLTVNGYAGYLTDASFQTPPTGPAPAFFTRSSVATDLANVVGANFFAGAPPFNVISQGQTSALVVIQTDSVQFSPNFASIIDGTSADLIPTYAPGPSFNVPEPSTLLLGAFGFVSLTVAAVRRRRK